MTPKRTRVVNLRAHTYDVYIGRPGKGQDGYFGNPIRRGETCPVCGKVHEAKGETLYCFEDYFAQRLLDDPEYRRRVEGLRGKTLGCFCKPKPCHGDVIAGWLNKEATMPNVIDEFRGKFRWLSNFWEARIKVRGVEFPSTEHAFQAAKAIEYDEYEAIRTAPTFGLSKRLGGKCKRRPDWDGIRVSVMYACLLAKFNQHSDLAEKLQATGNAHLIEGNHWGDRFWGMCEGTGKNNLGKLLMVVRAQLNGSQADPRLQPFFPEPPRPEGVRGLVDIQHPSFPFQQIEVVQ